MNDDDGISNRSGNRTFGEVLAAGASRRGVLSGGLVVAATGFLGARGALARGWERDDGWGHKRGKPYRPRGRGLLGFPPVPLENGSGPRIAVSADYTVDVLIPWATP